MCLSEHYLRGGGGQGGVLFNFCMYLIFIVYDATAHKMCLQILLQNKPAKFYQETNIEIYKCIVLRIYKKKLPWLYIRNTYCVLIIAKFYDMHGDVLN